jgi:hypothetical protein
MIHVPEQNILIVMTAETNSAQKTIAKISNFWESHKESMIKLGSITILKILESAKGRFTFEKVWEQIFKSVPSAMHFTRSILVIGNVSGKVKQYILPGDF